MIYGYARVSTTGQANNGNSLDEQEKQLKEHGAFEIVKESYTGKTTDRPELKKLISKLKAGDTLMVTKLDRFARSVVHGRELIEDLLNKGITVHILNMGIINNEPINKVTWTIFLAFAEYERAMIVERTQAGKEVAKTKDGYKEGRPEIKGHLLNMALEKIQAGEWTYRQASKETGISLSTITRRMQKIKAEKDL